MPFTPLDQSQITTTEPVQEVETQPKIIGKSKKSIYPESQARAAGFTGRMIFSNSRMDQLEESGFNPVNTENDAVTTIQTL
jgi:hypothetical protein